MKENKDIRELLNNIDVLVDGKFEINNFVINENGLIESSLIDKDFKNLNDEEVLEPWWPILIISVFKLSYWFNSNLNIVVFPEPDIPIIAFFSLLFILNDILFKILLLLL